MIATAHTRYVRVTPQKARRVMREVRGLSANQALSLLQFAPQKPAVSIRKTLVSALANAEQHARNKGESFNVEDMFVVEAYVNEGPTMKRFRARAKGSGARILKRTSHLTVVVGDLEDKQNLAAKANEKAPAKKSVAAARGSSDEDKPRAQSKSGAKSESPAAAAKKATSAKTSTAKATQKSGEAAAKKPAAQRAAGSSSAKSATAQKSGAKTEAKADTKTDAKKGAE